MGRHAVPTPTHAVCPGDRPDQGRLWPIASPPYRRATSTRSIAGQPTKCPTLLTDHGEPRSNRQDLWMKILLGGFGLMGFVGSFDQLAVDEHRAGADEGDQMRCVDRAPAVLRGLDELERHREPSRA